MCYHVFHWRCLDDHCQQMPSTTAPAGYSCPCCGHEIIPKDNVVSPVADVIRRFLDSAQWALPLHRRLQNQQNTTSNHMVDAGWPTVSNSNSHQTFRETGTNNRNMPTTTMDPDTSTAARKQLSETPVTSGHRSFVTAVPSPEEEDKYKRKSMFELVSRWLQSKALLGTRRRDPTRRWLAMGIFAFIVIFLVVFFMSRVGGSVTEDDPFLDPHLNPDIHVKGS